MKTYEQKVKKYGPRFMKDLGLTKEQVAGIFGNFAVETGYFTLMQEVKPLVKGSKGGWGWAQWTGPRRRAFEKWADGRGLDRAADETNYAYVVYELNGGPESKALIALRKCTTAKSAAEIFCAKYERPGIPHLDKRIKAAEQALKILNQPIVSKVEEAVIVGTGATAGSATQIPADYFPAEYLPYAIGAIVVIGAAVFIYTRWKRKKNVWN